MKRKPITYILFSLLLPVVITSCIYEHPSLTDDGEMGIDPTQVIVKANLTLNLKYPSITAGQPDWQRPVVDGNPEYRHRFIIEAYIDRQLADRQVFYEDVESGVSKLSIPISLKLHARNYRLAVWSDYVKIGDENDFFYNTKDNHLLTVLGSETYRGNDNYKDAFCGTTELNLSMYRNEWNAQITLPLELQRPVARYELVADDVTAFLHRISEGSVTGTVFTARLKYNSYLNMGYNVLDGLARHRLMYIQYQKTIRTTDMIAGNPFSLMFDYTLTDADVLTRIPVTLEIVDSKSVVVAATTFNISCQAGKYTTITHNFLTSDPNGGIHIDPGFDGSKEIEIPAQ